MRSRHARAYRALLRLYPRRFRDDFLDEMTRVFAQQLHYARVTEGWPGVVRVWAHSLVDLVRTAPSEHLEDEELVSSAVGAGNWPPPPLPTRHLPARWFVLGSLPLVYAALLFIVAPNVMSVMYAIPSEILGVPAGAVFLAVAAALAVVGLLLIVRFSSSPARAIAFLVFTCGAETVVAMGPALILIIRNVTI